VIHGLTVAVVMEGGSFLGGGNSKTRGNLKGEWGRGVKWGKL
jgi:hypothetical protein